MYPDNRNTPSFNFINVNNQQRRCNVYISHCGQSPTLQVGIGSGSDPGIDFIIFIIIYLQL